jgi:Ras GTPase-activating-like protein IQGAP2/3
MSRSKTGKLNLHGLDRLSERSDGSNDGPLSENIGLGVPSSPTKKSSQGRRMASDAGEDETGAIVIPGITVGSDSVAGMTGRLRLARQPTQTRYGNLPSVTAKAMDNQRQNLQAYEYLCHVSEAKEWLVSCLSAHPLSPSMNTRSPDLASPTFSPVQNGQDGDDNDPSGLSNKSVVELEEALRNGVALARLARAFMGEKAVPRIFTVSIIARCGNMRAP